VFYCTFVFLYNIVSRQLALLLLINNDDDDDDDDVIVLSGCLRCDIEIAYLVDSSTKSSSTDWQNVLNLLNSFAGNFNVNPNCHRHAMILYSDSARVSFGLTRYSTLASLQQAIRSITAIGSGSNLLSALQLLRLQVFTDTVRRTRARLVAGIVTDSLTCSNELIRVADELKKWGIVIVAIAYTQRGQVDIECLREIVTANQYIEIDNYASYEQYISTAVSAVCPPDYWGKSCSVK